MLRESHAAAAPTPVHSTTIVHRGGAGRIGSQISMGRWTLTAAIAAQPSVQLREGCSVARLAAAIDVIERIVLIPRAP